MAAALDPMSRDAMMVQWSRSIPNLAGHASLFNQARKAEESLSDFAALMWPILEPKRKLIRGYAWDAICAHLEAVHRGDIQHLLINVPPGLTKSLLCNVFFPAWEWGPRNRPDLRMLGFSYAEKLTIRDNRRCRELIKSPLYQLLWGDRFRITADQDAKGRFDNDHQGFKIASSVGGTGTGERGDRLIIDDPNNVKDADSDLVRTETNRWFAEVTPTRINDPGKSAIIVIQQRTHSLDVSGKILDSDLEYEHLCLPMEFEVGRRCFTSVPRKGTAPQLVRKARIKGEEIDTWVDADAELPERIEKIGDPQRLYSQDWRTEPDELLVPNRFTRFHIERELKPALRMMSGTYAEAGQLQQRPTPRGGGMFKAEDLQILEHSEWPTGGKYARGYDLAATTETYSAFSASAKIAVIGTGTGRKTYIENVCRIKAGPGKVLQWMQTLAEADGINVVIDFPIDPGQAAQAQKGQIGSVLGEYTFFASTESGKKEDRAGPLASQADIGNVYLLKGPWNDDFIGEAINFPRGRFKDQIDASTRAYSRALKLAARSNDSIPVGPLIAHQDGSTSGGLSIQELRKKKKKED